MGNACVVGECEFAAVVERRGIHFCQGHYDTALRRGVAFGLDLWPRSRRRLVVEVDATVEPPLGEDWHTAALDALLARREKRRAALSRAKLARELQKFGLTPEDYERMLAEQGGVCPICLAPPTANKRLAVDHCHRTGIVRGLLCGDCNAALGFLRDNPESANRAADYLRNHP